MFISWKFCVYCKQPYQADKPTRLYCSSRCFHLERSSLINPGTKDYLKMRNPTHPLAQKNGQVRIHRAVLYDKIGAGEHHCHWCNRKVVWNGKGVHRIHADHLDGNRWNNTQDNLVPSCIHCNSRRNKQPDFLTHCKAGHVYTPENTYWRPDGNGRQCRLCNQAREKKRKRSKVLKEPSCPSIP